MAPPPQKPRQQPSIARALSHDPASVDVARKFTEHILDTWGIGDRVDDVLLCVSELATNAVLHGAPEATGILVRLRISDHLLRAEVHDSSPALPEQRYPDDDSDTGRGLLLVSACADGWGVDRYADHKVVWAEFKIDAPVAMTVIAC
ncbi:ATP-binding protein [Streptomyces sp. GESEQ-35]|uniref:ATP-binding protein n=1 Tax=Streptomyces sp. GESEQ-35 TaxID=2812657 RepID=UPI001B318F88|nr:ATP-binding protein [Streptomyces sp. GESEQ-35]